ncbi:hypothetical protein D047_3591B, partial [Vibrio parahaemolyticus VPTS-2010_2]
TTTSQ